MGLLSDYGALGSDQQQLGVLKGNAVTAHAAADAADAAVVAQGTVDDSATATVVADLQDPNYGGISGFLSADGTTFTLLTIVPAVPPSTQAGLAIQVIKVAN